MKEKTNKNRKLFTVIIIIAVALVVAATVGFAINNSIRVTSQNRAYLLDSAGEMAERINLEVSEGYININLLGDNISGSLDSTKFDTSSLKDLTGDSAFDYVNFVDADGIFHYQDGETTDASGYEFYTRAKDGMNGMTVVYGSPRYNETLLVFYCPIYYNDEFAGSIIGMYKASGRIANILTTEYFGEEAVSYVAAKDGRIISSNIALDTAEELYMTDLAQGDNNVEKILTPKLENIEPQAFSVQGNRTGGCLIKLERTNGYLIQFFPEEASERMIREANTFGFILAGVLLLAYIIVLIVVIISYRRQNKEVEEAKAQADTANKAKSNFLFNMSHDIRTPMNAIIGFTDKAIANRYDPEILDSALTKVKESSSYLLRILNDILDMAKIESGKIEINNAICMIEGANETLLSVMSEQAAAKKITFHTRYDIRDKWVWMDENRTGQILSNLISNAIKYTGSGGDVWFSIDQAACDIACHGKYIISVKDNGCGMSDEFVAKIFEEFERDASAIKSGAQGTGLGMAIVKKLVDTMGGNIEVKSIKGRGTAIEVTLILKIATTDEISRAKEKELRSKVAPRIRFKGKRILLVEDNELNREIALDILEENGFVVECAEDGSIAYKMVKATADRYDYEYYDAILMDVQMPIMNGYEATRAIRAIPGPEKFHMPIIAMTANAFEEDRKNAFEAGMDDHVAKPIDVETLKDTLARYL